MWRAPAGRGRQLEAGCPPFPQSLASTMFLFGIKQKELWVSTHTIWCWPLALAPLGPARTTPCLNLPAPCQHPELDLAASRIVQREPLSPPVPALL